jgi:hypothetical protein
MNSIIRRSILALSLIAGIAPAVAQAPPPVPALPDTERRTTYSITASTCGCAVGFALYGDSTDYTNWIEVFVNGALVPQSGNWTLTSATGSLGTIPRPITNAVLNFTSAQTGTVQIVGARRPRRTSQFTENRGVAARDLNQVITDVVAMLRENWDKTNDVSGRAVLARPGETLALLPVLANRINQGACFDSNGNLVNCVSIPSTTLFAGAGIALSGVGPTTVSADIVAGNGIQITGTHPMVVTATAGAAALFVRPQDYGAVCDGVTNDATALQNMLTGSANKTIFIPAGTCLSNSTLTMPSNTTITGAGREDSILKCAANPCLSSTNASNIDLSNFQILGTNSVVSWAASSFGPISISQDGSAIAAGSNYNIQRMKFAGFNASYWVYFSAAGSTFSMRNITFADNYVLTSLANIPAGSPNSQNGNTGLVIFSGAAGNGRIEDTIIRNNRFDVANMCIAVVLYSNHYKFQINNNLILAPGTVTPNHCANGGLTANNAYGIAVYDLNGDGNPPQNGLVSGNTIISPVSAGIYTVGDGASNSVYSNNLIDGQSAQDDSSLPRGGIVINGLSDIMVSGNKISNSFGGIVASSQTAGTVAIIGNTCKSGVGAGASLPFCIRIAAGVGASNNILHAVKGNTLEQQGGVSTVVRMLSTTGNRLSNVDFSDNTVIAAQNGLDMSSQWFNGTMSVKNNRFGGVGSTILMGGIGSGATAFAGNVFITPTNAPTVAQLPASAINGSSLYLTDGAPASSPCTGTSSGSTAFKQNGAWKCF